MTRKIRFHLLMNLKKNNFFLSYFFTKFIKVISPEYFLNCWYSRQAADHLLSSYYKLFNIPSLWEAWRWWMSAVALKQQAKWTKRKETYREPNGFRVKGVLIIWNDDSQPKWQFFTTNVLWHMSFSVCLFINSFQFL